MRPPISKLILTLLLVLSIALIAICNAASRAQQIKLNYTFNKVEITNKSLVKVYGYIHADLHENITLRIPVIVIKSIVIVEGGNIRIVKILNVTPTEVNNIREVYKILRYEQVIIGSEYMHSTEAIIKIIYVPLGIYTFIKPIKIVVKDESGRPIEYEYVHITRSHEIVSIPSMTIHLGNTSNIVIGNVANIELAIYGKVFVNYTKIECCCHCKSCGTKRTKVNVFNLMIHIPLAGVRIYESNHTVKIYVLDKKEFAKRMLFTLVRHVLWRIRCRCKLHCKCCGCHLISLSNMLDKIILRLMEIKREFSDILNSVKREVKRIVSKIVPVKIHLYIGPVSSAGDIILIPIDKSFCTYNLTTGLVSECREENALQYVYLNGFKIKPHYEADIALALLWYYDSSLLNNPECSHVGLLLFLLDPICIREELLKSALRVLNKLSTMFDRCISFSTEGIEGRVCIKYFVRDLVSTSLMMNMSSNEMSGNEETSYRIPSINITGLSINVTLPRLNISNVTSYVEGRRAKAILTVNLSKSGAVKKVTLTINVTISLGKYLSIANLSNSTNCTIYVRHGNVLMILNKSLLLNSNRVTEVIKIPPGSSYLIVKLNGNVTSGMYTIEVSVKPTIPELNYVSKPRSKEVQVRVVKLKPNIEVNSTLSCINMTIKLSSLPDDIRKLLKEKSALRAVLDCGNGSLGYVSTIVNMREGGKLLVISFVNVPVTNLLFVRRCVLRLYSQDILLLPSTNMVIPIVPLTTVVHSVLYNVSKKLITITFRKPVERVIGLIETGRPYVTVHCGRRCSISIGNRVTSCVLLPLKVTCSGEICVPVPLELVKIIR